MKSDIIALFKVQRSRYLNIEQFYLGDVDKNDPLFEI